MRTARNTTSSGSGFFLVDGTAGPSLAYGRRNNRRHEDSIEHGLVNCRGHLYLGRLQRQQEFGGHNNRKLYGWLHCDDLVNGDGGREHNSKPDDDDGGSGDRPLL